MPDYHPTSLSFEENHERRANSQQVTKYLSILDWQLANSERGSLGGRYSTSILVFIKRHPIATYYVLVFAISWGGVLAAIGPSRFLGTEAIFGAQFMYVIYLAPLVGPCLAGILSAGIVYGKAGLRDFRSRLLRWRVGVRWYAIALLTAPLLTTATLVALSLTPAIVTASDKVSLLVSGIAVGLVVPFFEELGWTGFAVPELRKRYGILTTGLIVGLLWGAWHFPLFSGSATSSGALHPALFLAVLLFSWLPPYRVLMVWVYDHTKSLIVVMLMHTLLVVCQFVLIPAGISGAPVVTYDLIFAAALWVVIAVVFMTKGPTRR